MNKAITAAALSSALLVGGTTTATGLYKEVDLVIDGHVTSASTFALTVADVLAAKGITLGERDLVSPSVDAPVSDGQTVAVQFSKPITLQVDGDAQTFFTHAATVGAVLAQHPVADLDTAWLSLAPSATLPRAGLTLTVSTPKQVRLKVAGKVRELTTSANTVAHLLTEQKVAISSTDRVKPGLETVLAENDTIVVDLVDVRTVTKTEAVNFDTIEKNNASLWKGESRILTAGEKGKATRTYQITEVNGEVTKRVVLSETMHDKPSSQVVEVGTKTTANGVGLNLARSAMWDRIARCESGGRWSINTGNGYYGGLQFSLASWRANGGRDFAAYPHQASRAEQITVANRYYAKAGTSPWSCA